MESQHTEVTHTNRVVSDSVSETLEVTTEDVIVPASSVTLTIVKDSLLSLPAGASYSGRSGQASVRVSRQAATASEPEYIYVDASCDSLLLACARYERRIRNLRQVYNAEVGRLEEELEATKEEEREWKEDRLFLSLVVGLGLLGMIGFINLKKQKKL